MPEDGRVYISRKKTILNREQKTGFGMVVAFGALALIFGVFYMWKHVASPFSLSYTGPKILTGDEQQQAEMETLRKEDTDGDGLNDYDELYVYRTSPYIADSDSDGVSDITEIQNGKDPNCAPGMACDAAVSTVNPTTLKDTFIADVAAEAGTGMSAAEAAVASADPSDIAAILTQMTSEEIRQLLVDSGGDVAAVNALTDDELQAAFSEALQSLQIENATSDSTTPSTDSSATP